MRLEEGNSNLNSIKEHVDPWSKWATAAEELHLLLAKNKKLQFRIHVFLSQLSRLLLVV